MGMETYMDGSNIIVHAANGTRRELGSSSVQCKREWGTNRQHQTLYYGPPLLKPSSSTPYPTRLPENVPSPLVNNHEFIHNWNSHKKTTVPMTQYCR